MNPGAVAFLIFCALLIGGVIFVLKLKERRFYRNQYRDYHDG